MSDLSLSDRTPAHLKLDAIVIGLSEQDDEFVILPGAEALVDELGDGLTDALVALHASGAEGKVTKVATLGQSAVPLIVAVGSARRPPRAMSSRGSAPKPYAEPPVAPLDLSSGIKHAAITLASVNGSTEVELVAAIVEGITLGGYQYTEYKSEEPKPRDTPVGEVTVLVDKARDKDLKDAVSKAVSISEAVAMARDFVNAPPNDLYPETFAAKAKAFASKVGIKSEILDEKALHSGGYGGILAVGSGSDRGPRLVRLTYSPSGARKTPSLALVGKGITFDSGGISIKPGAKMDEMKSDMSGAAAVISAIVLIAALKLPIKVIATVPLAENLPSGTAYRPADIVTHRGGKTAEILNTDAEGRVVLADAIARACEDDPAYLIETSTLTGAQIVALGKRTAGVMGTEDFRDRVVESGNAVGEAAWGMPLPKEVREGMKSRTGDFANIGDGPGGMLAGGHYLKEFVADGVDWAHIDIAGPSFNTAGAHGYTPEGGSGVPVRTILAVAEDIIANG